MKGEKGQPGRRSKVVPGARYSLSPLVIGLGAAAPSRSQPCLEVSRGFTVWFARAGAFTSGARKRRPPSLVRARSRRLRPQCRRSRARWTRRRLVEPLVDPSTPAGGGGGLPRSGWLPAPNCRVRQILPAPIDVARPPAKTRALRDNCSAGDHVTRDVLQLAAVDESEVGRSVDQGSSSRDCKVWEMLNALWCGVGDDDERARRPDLQWSIGTPSSSSS